LIFLHGQADTEHTDTDRHVKINTCLASIMSGDQVIKNCLECLFHISPLYIIVIPQKCTACCHA